ncbi:MAG: glucodextranase DOMON-like domain-containing protein [Anaerolineales bacterium]
MRNRIGSILTVFLVLAILLGACTSPTPTAAPTSVPTQMLAATPTATPQPTASPTAGPTAEEPIYLSIIWHQHQPVYFKDPETGIYAKPWVRVHATKDYVDMAAILEQYPDIHVTFNLTPSLLRQLDDFVSGAKDLYWVTAEIPADQLTAEQQQFLLDRFFDTNPKIIARFPRYQELLLKRDAGEVYSEQDYRDLQVLFNLAWVDPDWLAQAPLADLVAKGSNFAEADKQILFDEETRLIAEVVPIHRKLQEQGQIEVTMTPFAHPILPLLVNTDLAREALPDVELPEHGFKYGQDAVAQVELGVDLYREHFGRDPRGMWPAEGAVAEVIVNMVSQNGIQWMASDEGVLANSLGMTSFTRDAREVVVEADKLYRPYYVQGTRGEPVAMVFRDVLISDKVGFTYSGMPGEAAAQDFIDRIHAIRDQLNQQGAEGPHLVSVILDGENAWEYYDNDGKAFLHTLYQELSADPLIKTVTPSEFLSIAPEQPMIDKLWAGSWINHDFSTWIGEEEENQAWDYLASTRDYLEDYLSGREQAPSEEALAEAKTMMYIGEGSDWFWWYGSDQNSGNDEAFDQQFRSTLEQVYAALGDSPPAELAVPIIPLQSVTPDVAATGLISPTIDGVEQEEEWASAGVYSASGGAMAAAQPFFESLAYGFGRDSLYLKVVSNPDYPVPANEGNLEIYLSVPGGGPINSFSRAGTLLGFSVNRMIEVRLQDRDSVTASVYPAGGDQTWDTEPVPIESVATDGNVIELAVPLADLGDLEVGNRINLRAVHNEVIGTGEQASLVDTDILPGNGTAVFAVPDLGTTTLILEVDDPAGDDYGPGSYTYPQDTVFAPGNFDILNFQVGEDEQNVIFQFTLAGPVENVWDSSNGLSVQTFDVYIDTDGDNQGGKALLPGRNLALADGFAWDYAITAEGWTSGIFEPGESGPTEIAQASQFTVLADPGQQKVALRVPKAIIGEDPSGWAFAAMVLGQEGFPAAGVMRVRDVNTEAAQWRFGGAPPGTTNHTRVIDYVWPQAGQQEAWLSDFSPSDAAQTALTAADFAQVEMLENQN